MQTLRVVRAVAPIRICDCGGWTDTWFAGHGRVFNVGVSPFVEVQVEVLARDAQAEAVIVTAENYGQSFVPSAARLHHPLIEAAVERMRAPDDVALRIAVWSEMPPGASTGTSASLCVALLGALDALTPGRLTAAELAQAAFEVETRMLGRQSGLQDQLCAAHGGLSFVEIDEFPRAKVTRLEPPDATFWELEQRLALVYLGRTHDSSEVHQRVIRELEDAGPDHAALSELRRCAERARDAVVAGDLESLGRAMIANTDAQAGLHASLVGSDARRVIELGRAHGCIGWKVNGAGGEGGSVTLLAGRNLPAKRALGRALHGSPGLAEVPVRISRLGVRVWQSP